MNKLIDELVAQQLEWVQVTLPSYQGKCIQPYVPADVAKLRLRTTQILRDIKS